MIWHLYDGGFWFRITQYGWGFSVVDKLKNPPLFSERNGYKKVFRIGKFGIKLLKPLEDK